MVYTCSWFWVVYADVEERVGEGTEGGNWGSWGNQQNYSTNMIVDLVEGSSISDDSLDAPTTDCHQILTNLNLTQPTSPNKTHPDFSTTLTNSWLSQTLTQDGTN